MKTIGFVLTIMLFAGCREHFLLDTTPPVPPEGIQALALDNAVELSWLPNPEPDVAGYKVWVSDTYDGRYHVIGSTDGRKFVDYGASNGIRTYYGVTAYDYDRNESELSTDVVYATPRPEGYGVKIYDYLSSPGTAGYDFSTYSIGNYNDDYTDFFFESTNGHFYLDVWKDSDIQDTGYTRSLYEIAVAPAAGWSPSKYVEAIVGHTYVIWTWDDHYAKVRVREVTASRITFDWTYQVAKSNPELKREATANGTRNFHPKDVSLIAK
jgi:hypothetical protein